VSLVERFEAGAEEVGRGGAAGGEPSGTRGWVLEAVREGYLLHYAEPRAFEGMDPDLELLGGDTMYALGLARLAEDGDLEAVVELADLISACAQAESESRSTDELWSAAARRLARPNPPE
jgi:hypothetical protein